jgi:hypothetical protein
MLKNRHTWAVATHINGPSFMGAVDAGKRVFNLIYNEVMKKSMEPLY